MMFKMYQVFKMLLLQFLTELDDLST